MNEGERLLAENTGRAGVPAAFLWCKFSGKATGYLSSFPELDLLLLVGPVQPRTCRDPMKE